MEVSGVSFKELVELFGSSLTPLKFEHMQGTVFLGVDDSGSLLVRKKV